MATELNSPSRIDRVQESYPENQANNPKKPGKPSFVNFMAMIFTAVALDILSLIPGLNLLTIFIADLIFIPWFYVSGMKFNSKRIASFGITSLAEAIPFLSALPTITLNVLINYYLA